MRFRTALFAILFAVGVFALPLAVHAGVPFFGPIIPDELNKCAAGWGMIITVINNIISLLITLAIIFVAPLMIAWAGFLFVVNPVNASGKEQAKKILTNTIVGIVIALAGYMIVAAIMSALYDPSAGSGKTKLGVWMDIVGSRGLDPCIPLAGSLRQAPSGGLITGVSATSTIAVVPPSTMPASETIIRNQLRTAGVGVNKPACSPYNLNGVTNGCTNVGMMLSSTVAQIIAIKSSCGCDVTVTGGSESGHATGQYSHGTGYKVDLRRTASIDNYFQSMTYVGIRTGDSRGDAYTDKCGQNQYVRESTHWDITVRSTCAPPK